MNEWNIETGKNKNGKFNDKIVLVIAQCMTCGAREIKVHFVESVNKFYWYHALYKVKYGIGGHNAHKKPPCKHNSFRIEFTEDKLKD